MNDPYSYPNTNILKNKFGIKDKTKLNIIERNKANKRLIELKLNPITGQYDLKHLQKIHKHIFQDIYTWAGELRTVNIGKGQNFFCLLQHIDYAQKDIFNSLKKDNYLNGLNLNDSVNKLAYYLGEINMLHPFREGNGRTQRAFIEQLALKNDLYLKFPANREEMIKASIHSSQINNDEFAKIISNNICSVKSLENIENFSKPLKNLKWSAPSDELYKAAAKEAMQQGGSFKFDNPNNEHELSTDKIVMQKLVDKGISPQRIKEVMKHSPQIEGKNPAEKAIKLQQFSKQLEKIPSLSKELER